MESGEGDNDMKTLADLKRELTKGKRLRLIYRYKPLSEPIPKEVSGTQGNGVSFIDPNADVRKPSFLEFPKASLLEVTPNGFRIYGKGLRDLTPDEAAIRQGEPRDKEQEECDLMGDSNVMYHAVRGYYTRRNAEYLQGHMTQRGMRYDYNTGKVFDDKVKGELALEYVFEKVEVAA